MRRRRAAFIGLFLTFGSTAAFAARDGEVVKAAIRAGDAGPNLLKPGAWRAFHDGYKEEGGRFVCDNGGDARAVRGVSQTVVFDPPRPAPMVATARSRAEGVGGTPDADYAVYVDLVYADGTPLWGQTATFHTGTHDWAQARVLIVPEKPVRSVTVNLLLRKHSGRAEFRDAELRAVDAPKGGTLFDGVPVVSRSTPAQGFQVRDAAAGGDFVVIDRAALGLTLETATETRDGVTHVTATLRDTTGKDRAVTLVYTVPVSPAGLRWLDDPRHATPVTAGREYVSAGRFQAGSNGRLSRYPFAAVAGGTAGRGLGIDMAAPAFYRVGYNSGSGELFLAYDLALTPERPSARVKLAAFPFRAGWDFRSALDAYYRAFPEAFRVRVDRQGLWMPFAKISTLKGWQDFGFRFKEGNDETAWDDAHGVVTFRYTEPLTWWMPMPKGTPRTVEAAVAEARRLADRGRVQAKALFTSGYHDAEGQFALRMMDTPWNDGAVWSMNSGPGVSGDPNDFATKWNAKLRTQLYGPGRRGDLDGEYVDSSEGYVTDELDFRREHFVAAECPLVFAPGSFRPAAFRGLIAYEYVKGLERDVHGMGKLMMANATPDRLCWLAPLLDVMGTETDWNPQGRWRPMSDAELLYRRALCKGKPFCFLMNSAFENFSHELSERYMKRALAYGMFPGFFSHNASQGHYFTRPELYERDRPLFRKYVPLCRAVAEAGWEPETLARSNDALVHVERFGRAESGPLYLTVFNDSRTRRSATLTLDGLSAPGECRERVGDRSLRWEGGKATLELGPEDVAVLELRH